jgi:hypothetical protein
MAVESLVIGDLTADIVLPRNHPRPHELRDRIDTVLHYRLEPALKQALDSAEFSGRDGVLLIRKLELDLEWNSTLDAADLARSWARVIACGLLEQLHQPASGTLRFETPAALLAQYLRDRARNAVDNRWYYRAFEGLAMLDAAAAIRSSILDHIETGLAALLLLAPYELLEVLTALADADLTRMVAAFATGSAAREEAAAAVLAAWQSNPQRPARHTLFTAQLFIEAVRHQPGVRSRELGTLCRAAGRYFTAASDIRDAVNRADLPALYELAGADLSHALHPIAELPSEIRGQFAQAAASHATRSTAFGGVFLLLPILDEIFADEDFDRITAIHMRYIALMNCYGPERAAEFMADPLLADFFEVDSLANLDELAADELAPVLLQAFARRLPGFSQSSPAHLAANFLEFNATVDTLASSDLILVRASYPPLGVILSLNGMLRQSYSLRWMPGREWRIFPEA